MDDLISKQDALELVKDVCDAIMSCCGSHYDKETKDEVYDDVREVDAILKCNKEIRIALKNMPSAQPEYTGHEESILTMLFEIAKLIIDLQGGYMEMTDGLYFDNNDLFDLAEKFGINY